MLIYLIGGFDGMDYFNSVRCFNPVAKEWFEVAPMNSRRYRHTSPFSITVRPSCTLPVVARRHCVRERAFYDVAYFEWFMI